MCDRATCDDLAGGLMVGCPYGNNAAGNPALIGFGMTQSGGLPKRNQQITDMTQGGTRRARRMYPSPDYPTAKVERPEAVLSANRGLPI